MSTNTYTYSVGNIAPLSTALGNANLSAVGAAGNYVLTNTGTWSNSTASINANGTIKCNDLEIDEVSMKDVLKQISEQVGLFIPPNIETMNVPAVQQAYEDYRMAREQFMQAKRNLDLMVDLCRQKEKE